MSQDNSSTEYIPMIEQVLIENFKGIKHCEIKDIGKVNLFIGRNGCGKSSIMEAMYFTGKEFLGDSLSNCIRRRANRNKVSARELWYGYDTRSEVNVKLEFSAKNFTAMSVRFFPEDKTARVFLSSGGAGSSYSPEFAFAYKVANFGGATAGHRRLHSPQHNSELRAFFNRSVFIDPAIKTNVRQIEGSYLNVVKLSEADSSALAKRTAEIYETESSWEFLPHQDFPPDTPSRFAILEGKKRLFFDNFGDGLHYGLAIMAVAKTRNKTALFIEEIESHQHPEAIKSLIPNLLDIARMNDLQLFITTHNPYVLRYLHYHYKSPAERKKEFRCFHVKRDVTSGKAEAKIEEGILNIYEDILGSPQ